MTASPVPLHLSPLRRGHAAEVLTLAFHQDPIACYVFPEETRRHRVLRWMFHCHLRYGLRYGEVYTTDGIDGVAIWLSPGTDHPDTLARAAYRRPCGPPAVWLECFPTVHDLYGVCHGLAPAVCPRRSLVSVLSGCDPRAAGAGDRQRFAATRARAR
jgi:hypothetical protein